MTAAAALGTGRVTPKSGAVKGIVSMRCSYSSILRVPQVKVVSEVCCCFDCNVEILCVAARMIPSGHVTAMVRGADVTSGSGTEFDGKPGRGEGAGLLDPCTTFSKERRMN